MSVLEAFRLDGVVSLVTGAGRGLGAAAAAALAEAGATVVLAGRSAEGLLAITQKISDSGADVTAERLDVTEEASVISCFERVRARHGGVDVLVNNAGIEHSALAVDLEADDFDRVLRTNLIGSFLCARTFARNRSRGDDRAIVNVASLFAESGVRGQMAYGASKAAVVSMTRTLALEFAGAGIRVNAIAPGYFATDMPAAVLGDPISREKLIRRIPLRRIGEPVEIGPPVLFLASRASNYMTGSIVYIDGGFTV